MKVTGFFRILLLVGAVGGLGMGCASYKQAYEITPPGVVEVKDIPEGRIMITEAEGDYFSNANMLFGRLFNYLDSNKMSMTTPVEAEFSGKSSMIFHIGPSDSMKALDDKNNVRVLKVPKKTVVSVGGTGSYSKKNIDVSLAVLDKWFKDHPGYRKKGEPYAVFWNSPFMIWFLRKYEVHVEIEN